ncbi:MAG: hypothetical protein AVDCRST_MAG59-659 [uncultured Thermomicrobiales bacterium]|uniref:Nitroreductase family deazaflavin-dependent oxidoreductase n=1 Tax=uncultured Thermomicrobiales bacterium TaxID=1645740 RepID=A0A6J4U2S3_9BACT|nr:MAG: hypothetical protein AVDCRST_MAG59-659 [uncultured Thermomicrobiales bacterium]
MAKNYRPSPAFRVANTFVGALLRRGIRLGENVLLTVPGRTSGQPRTTPVTILKWGSERFLQSPFGEVDWVRNLRAAGRGTLTRGRRVEEVAVVELSPAEAAPVYQGTLASFPAPVRARFGVAPGAPLAAFEEEARHHPMFRLVRPSTAAGR